MSPDFQGMHILDSFLDTVHLNQLKSVENELSSPTAQNSPYQLSGPKLNNMGCKICKISTFDNLEEFKQHRQSEEHLNNLTDSLSISGCSNNSDSEEDNNLCKGSPFCTILNCESKLECYKALIFNRKNENYSKSTLKLTVDIYKILKQMQSSCIALALNGGGYFASAIFDNSEKKLVCSKTFRRYTTRRKQGGSQGLKDNQKSGKIHSAGALIRRENEKKLQDEISNLFLTWKPHLEKCSVIFCNRDPFLIQEVFKDFSVRILPFTTYQADFEEICRCYTELISSIKLL